MNLAHRTILVTGGTSGIGLGLAAAFDHLGSTVIVCGRDPQKLAWVSKNLPGVTALPCDLADQQQRQDLAAGVLERFPGLDILVNNAGIQRYVNIKRGYDELSSGEDEIAINLVAPLELTALLVGHLMEKRSAAVINVSSGLGFMPMLNTPVYNATKAALHTWTLVLRRQLKDTHVRVVEIVPPWVDTNLNRSGRSRARGVYHGLSIGEYIPSVIKGLEQDEDMIFYGEDGGNVMSRPRNEIEERLLNPSW